ncbi:hypothetical protein OEA41_010568 [Lepraria neglecta]|uniref:RRM domain-containing protein n=1 Tax=Lepraria neglecta TaxID=209136 RepID=A0AAE0DF96_9LECA|nr:hypothetical protein OEA41_010568 [Lepraria neglecta]
MSGEVSSTRLYLGNLPRDVAKEDIQNHFKDGTGNITEIKLMNGFGFIEYDDALDARDVVPAFRLGPLVDLLALVDSLVWSRNWTDLKDFARRSELDVVYSEVGRDRDGKGFVEFETASDLKVAVNKLDNQDFKGANVRCTADTQDEVPRNDRYRSRSPPPFRRSGGYPPSDGYYTRGPPPRGYSPRRDEYRRRSPPPRDDYYSRHGSYRSPPPARAPRPPIDDPYPPPARGGYGRDDPYGVPPPRRGYDDPYATNGYDRPRARSPPRAYGGYDERPPPRYW